MATVRRVPGSPAPGRSPLRRLLGLGSVLAVGVTMVGGAVAGLAGVDERLAAKAPKHTSPAATDRDCPKRDSYAPRRAGSATSALSPPSGLGTSVSRPS